MKLSVTESPSHVSGRVLVVCVLCRLGPDIGALVIVDRSLAFWISTRHREIIILTAAMVALFVRLS